MHFSSTAQGYQRGKSRKIHRPRKDRMLAGVCAGLAAHFNFSLFWTRFGLFLVACFHPLLAFLFYLIAAIIMPSEKSNRKMPVCEFEVPPPPLFTESGTNGSGKETLDELNKQFNSIEAKIQFIEDHVTSKEYILRKKFEEL